MKKEHITFNKLSDLCDNALPQKEADSLMAHLQACSACSREYSDINTLVKMVSCLRFLGMKSGEDLVGRTMAQIRKRRRRHALMKYLPTAAVAASIIVMFGFGFFSSDIPMEESRKDLAVTTEEAPEAPDFTEPARMHGEITSRYDIDRTLGILQSNRARVVRLTDSYIDAEISLGHFRRMAGEFNLLKHGSPMREVNTRNMANEPGSLSEEFDFSQEIYPPAPVADNRVVRFRINLE